MSPWLNPVGAVELIAPQRLGQRSDSTGSFSQAVGGDSLADQLVGVDAIEAALRQGLQNVQIDRLRAPALIHLGSEVAFSQQGSHHLLPKGTALKAVAYSKDAVEGARVFEEGRKTRHQLQVL